jgi:hypothetical protein
VRRRSSQCVGARKVIIVKEVEVSREDGEVVQREQLGSALHHVLQVALWAILSGGQRGKQDRQDGSRPTIQDHLDRHRCATHQHGHDLTAENFTVLKNDTGSWFCQEPRCHRKFDHAYLLVNHFVEYHWAYIRPDHLKQVGGRRAIGDRSDFIFGSDADMLQAMTLRQGPGATPVRSYLVPPPNSQIRANDIRMTRLAKDKVRVADVKARRIRARRRGLANDRSRKYGGNDPSGEDSIGEETEDELELE